MTVIGAFTGFWVSIAVFFAGIFTFVMYMFTWVLFKSFTLFGLLNYFRSSSLELPPTIEELPPVQPVMHQINPENAPFTDIEHFKHL